MKRLSAVMTALFFIAACSDSTAPLAPFEPEVTNAVDNFQLQATDVEGVGTTLEYLWVNTGTQASVDHSTTTLAGMASVEIRDGTGTIVYSEDLSPSLNEDTTSGTAGTWTINLVLADYSGTLNFRVQKK